MTGLDHNLQPLRFNWAFRNVGTGERGLVNASYGAIILNEKFGGFNFVFPPQTAGTLSASMAQDQLGAFGVARRPTTVLRVVSVAACFVGSMLTQDASPPTPVPAAKSERSE